MNRHQRRVGKNLVAPECPPRLGTGHLQRRANGFDSAADFLGGPLANGGTNRPRQFLMPQVQPIDHAILRLGKRLFELLGRADIATFTTFVDTIREWLSARLQRGNGEPHRLAQVAEVWEKLNRAARDVEVYNLERKPMVFAVFRLLAEAARH